MVARVTIIGAGNMARGIGTRLVAGGVDLHVVARDPAAASSLAGELRGGGSGGSVAGGALEEPLADGVIVLTTPYAAALEIAERRRDELAGRVVVDVTNPVDLDSFDRLVTPADSSAAEEIAKRAPAAHVVKAFNTIFAGTLVAGDVAGQSLDVFIAGDDADAKAAAVDLVTAGGMRAVDAGPLRRARQLEHMGFLHMALQDGLGSGFGSAVKVVTP